MYFVHCIGLSLSVQNRDSIEFHARFGGDRIRRDKAVILAVCTSLAVVFHYQSFHLTYPVSVEHLTVTVKTYDRDYSTLTI